MGTTDCSTASPTKMRTVLSEARFRLILRYFALDLSVTECAALSGISLRNIHSIYLRMRERMAQACAQSLPFSGELQADESDFGPRRVRGKRGHGTDGKTIVFGLLKRGQNIYTEIVPDASRKTLQAIIRGKVDPASIMNTDGWPACEGLVDMGIVQHFRLNHGSNEFVRDSRLSMVSSRSGALPNVGWRSSTVSPGRLLHCI